MIQAYIKLFHQLQSTTMANDSNTVVFYPTPVIDQLADDRDHYIHLQCQLQYMASRLWSALLTSANHKEGEDNQKWWLDCLWYEMVCLVDPSSTQF